MKELTVILEKNPTTGYWKAYVLQEGVRGPNLCKGTQPKCSATARSAAEWAIRTKTKYTGKINWQDGGAQ